jgi:hypothetical protein
MRAALKRVQMPLSQRVLDEGEVAALLPVGIEELCLQSGGRLAETLNALDMSTLSETVYSLLHRFFLQQDNSSRSVGTFLGRWCAHVRFCGGGTLLCSYQKV